MKTSSLDAIDVPHVLARSNSRKSQKVSVTATQIQDAAGAYKFLLYGPSEYLSRSSRNDLLKRAIALDIAVGVSPSLHQDANNVSLVVSLRAFLLRTFSFMGSADHQVRLRRWQTGMYLYINSFHSLHLSICCTSSKQHRPRYLTPTPSLSTLLTCI